MATRQLPVLDVLAPQRAAPTRADPRRPAAAPATLEEFVTDDLALPRFHVWTLGCQMNQSDSEEMAGALLAAGCAEASAMEQADLIVINSCAIRETAEAKIIGRQGQLSRLKQANPGLRVVLTGCAVRVENRERLGRRYPAVDLFLRPDEEPELVARLGLASLTAPGRLAGPGGPRVTRVTRGWMRSVQRRPVQRPHRRASTRPWPMRCRRSGQGPCRTTASRDAVPSRHGSRSSTAATRPARTASCRSAAGPNGAGRSRTSWTRRATWPRPATARSRCSART